MKNSKLDSYQKQQQKQSEQRILTYLKSNEPAYQTQISTDLKMDNKVIKKTINRLLDAKKINTFFTPGLSKKRTYYIRKNAPKKIRQKNLGGREPGLIQLLNYKPNLKLSNELMKFAFLAECYRIDKKQDKLNELNAVVFREIKKFRNPTLKLDMEQLESMVLLSESTMSKRNVCKQFGISVTQFDRLIKYYPHLSNLRNEIRKLNPIDFDP